MKLINLALFTICFVSCAFSQQKTQIATAKNGLFIKSCDRVATNTNSCVLCEDKELKKNCKTYTCDDFGQCAQFKLGGNNLKTVLQTTKIQGLKGIQKEATEFGVTDYYIQEGNVRTYFSKTESTLTLENYTVPTTTKTSAKPIQTSPSDKHKKCIQDCINICELCIRNCSGDQFCITQCNNSRLACGREVCNKFVPKSILNISIKGSSKANSLKVFE